jgi:hypothetical protein
MTTSVSTYTRVQTATHLADVVLGSIADILATLGVDATRVFADWDTDQKAIAAWISEGCLSMVILECHQPNGTVSPIFEFPVVYGFSVRSPGLARHSKAGAPAAGPLSMGCDPTVLARLLQDHMQALGYVTSISEVWHGIH